MHSTLKRVGCFALVLVLMFMIFAQPLAPKAEAAVIELTAGAFSSILSFLAMLGITFLTVEAARIAINGFVEAHPEVMAPGGIREWLENDTTGYTWWNLPGDSGEPPTPDKDPNNLWLGPAVVGLAGTLMAKLYEYFGGKNRIEIPMENIHVSSEMKYWNTPSSSNVFDFNTAWKYAFYTYKIYNDSMPLRITNNGEDYDIYIEEGDTYYSVSRKIAPDAGLPFLNSRSYGCIIPKSNAYRTISNVIDCRFGFARVNGQGVIGVFLVIQFIDSNGILRKEIAGDQYSSSGHFFANPHFLAPTDADTYYLPIDYNNNSPYSFPTIRDSLINKITTSPGPIVIDKTQVIDAIETDNNEKLQEETDQKKLIDMIPGLKDILEEIRDNQPDPEADFVPPELPGGDLSEKFPFCVPFDLFRIVKALNAPPVAPKWEIPVIFASVEYEDKITLDLGQFETLAIPIRWGLTLMYLLGLLVVSRKMIKG